MKLFDRDFTVDICCEGNNPYVKKAMKKKIKTGTEGIGSLTQKE